jgi:hypothetical protein
VIVLVVLVVLVVVAMTGMAVAVAETLISLVTLPSPVAVQVSGLGRTLVGVTVVGVAGVAE